MNRKTVRRARFTVGTVACWLLPAAAAAHAPLTRNAVFSVVGTAAAISLPGFGIAIRPSANEEFAYICDALLDVAPSDTAPPMAFAEGPALLVGTSSGIRRVGADGCPSSNDGGTLAQERVVALAVHPKSPNLVYAVTQGLTTALVRSMDGGQTWASQSTWPERDPVTALVLDDADTNAVYVSQDAPVNRSAVLVSTDGGATFSAFAGDLARVLLDVEGSSGSGPPRYWAVARSPSSVGNRGFDLLHAAAPGGPWTAAHQVNFFGGFAMEPSGAIWIGDEGGGVYRSLDGAVTFAEVSTDTSVACLSYAQGALWGCTPGTPQQRALVQWDDNSGTFADVVALDDVTRMVECDPPVDVAGTCALAWTEWQRDVLTAPTVKPPPADAGVAPPSESSSSCSFAVRAHPRKSPSGEACFALVALLLRISRRTAGSRPSR